MDQTLPSSLTSLKSCKGSESEAPAGPAASFVASFAS